MLSIREWIIRHLLSPILGSVTNGTLCGEACVDVQGIACAPMTNVAVCGCFTTGLEEVEHARGASIYRELVD